MCHVGERQDHAAVGLLHLDNARLGLYIPSYLYVVREKERDSEREREREGFHVGYLGVAVNVICIYSFEGFKGFSCTV